MKFEDNEEELCAKLEEKDIEIERLKKNWNRLIKLVKDNIRECNKLKTDCIHKGSKDCYGIVENREEVFAFIYSSMIEIEEGDDVMKEIEDEVI